MTTQTNDQAARKLQRSLMLEEVCAFRFQLPNGIDITVVDEADPFLQEPFQEGTKIKVLVWAEAGAPVTLFGDRWLVHQNDPDCIWPSDFHAHNRVGHETLDCHTGNIYNPTTKQLKRKYRRKKLAAVIAELPERVKPKSN